MSTVFSTPVSRCYNLFTRQLTGILVTSLLYFTHSNILSGRAPVGAVCLGIREGASEREWLAAKDEGGRGAKSNTRLNADEMKRLESELLFPHSPPLVFLLEFHHAEPVLFREAPEVSFGHLVKVALFSFPLFSSSSYFIFFKSYSFLCLRCHFLHLLCLLSKRFIPSLSIFVKATITFFFSLKKRKRNLPILFLLHTSIFFSFNMFT